MWAHQDTIIVHLVIDGEMIETTPEHPFYVGEGEWVPAGELTIGDEINGANGETGTVETIRFIIDPQPMYNFTVDVAHTYFVFLQDLNKIVSMCPNCNLVWGLKSMIALDTVYDFNEYVSFAGLYKPKFESIRDISTTDLKDS